MNSLEILLITIGTIATVSGVAQIIWMQRAKSARARELRNGEGK